jgi:hypothetical protein
LADAGRHVRQLAAHQQDHGSRETFAAFDKDLAGRDLCGPLRRVDTELLAGVAADHAGNGGAVSRAEEGLQASSGRLGRVPDCKLHALADLLADTRSDALYGLLYGLRALIDPFGGRLCKLLGGIAGRQGFEQAPPARLLAQLGNGLVDAVRHDHIDTAAPPLLIDDGPVIEADQALAQRFGGDGLDRGAKAGLVPGLAGLVLGPAGGLGAGAKGDRQRRYRNGGQPGHEQATKSSFPRISHTLSLACAGRGDTRAHQYRAGAHDVNIGSNRGGVRVGAGPQGASMSSV